jgi:cytochrome c oxidase subunit 4
MSHSPSHHPALLSPLSFTIVFLILAALTIATVAISFAPLHSPWHIVIGLSIAAIKASLVVLFFMHVIASPRLTWIVIAISITWIVILFTLTFSDYLTRGLVLFTPGH